MLDELQLPYPWHSEVTDSALREWAVRAYPNEACMVVGWDGVVTVLENGHYDPANAFLCPDLLPMLDNGEVAAFVHSHPDGPEYPSVADMQQQIATNVPWGIVVTHPDRAETPWFWGDMLRPPPLLHRDFRWGPSGTDGRGDCAAIVRDFHRLHFGRRLPEFPREKGWEKTDLKYGEALIKAGFQPADPAFPQVGDVWLASLRQHENHAGVYIGREQVLHHIENRFSAIEPAVGWMRHVKGWFRYAG